MKYSICTTFAKSKPIEDIVKIAVGIGLEGIEIWDGHIDDYLIRNPQGIGKLKDLLFENNLKCCCISPYFDFVDETQIEKSLQTAEKCIEYSKALDNKIIRTFLGNKSSANLTQKDESNCIQSLKKILLLAEKSNVCFALETHNDQPTDRAEYIIKILNECNSPYLKVIFDGFNFYVDNINMMQEYDVLREHIVHYHMKNYIWDKRIPVPLNQGDVDFTELIKILKGENKQDFMSFEYFCENVGDLVQKSLKWIDKV